ncbi:IS3 family transposase [Streptomyces sp. HK10]|uniref:IS3 family transposase n=1 Tax=Streptomyces sp. HK10 TaxID=3373255 RepID=UPI003749F406
MIEYLRDRDLGAGFACRALGLSESAYYERRKRPKSARRLRDEQLMPLIEQVRAEPGGTYGVRRITRALRRKGVHVARCTVERLMAELGRQNRRDVRNPFRDRGEGGGTGQGRTGCQGYDEYQRMATARWRAGRARRPGGQAARRSRRAACRAGRGVDPGRAGWAVMSGQARSSVVVIRDSTPRDHRRPCLPPRPVRATGHRASQGTQPSSTGRDRGNDGALPPSSPPASHD